MSERTPQPTMVRGRRRDVTCETCLDEGTIPIFHQTTFLQIGNVPCPECSGEQGHTQRRASP